MLGVKKDTIFSPSPSSCIENVTQQTKYNSFFQFYLAFMDEQIFNCTKSPMIAIVED